MIGFILSLIGIVALCVLSFVVGAVATVMGAYAKIKDAEGEDMAQLWLSKMNDKKYGR